MDASPTFTDTQPMSGGPTPAPAGDIANEPPAGRGRKIAVLLLLLLLLAALLGLSAWYLLFRQPIPLPALPGAVVLPAYSTSFYGTQRPMGVAVNSAGDRVYVGETGGDNTARVLDGQGNELGRMEPPASTGTDHVPVYLAMNPVTSEVYVSDRRTGSIYVYDASGAYLRSFAPLADFEGWQPLGLWFDAAGSLFVTDVGTEPNLVRQFDPSGKQVRTYGEEAAMSFPNGVATDAAGNVYVTDSNNGRLLVFAPDGTQVAQVGRGSGTGNLGLPRGVTVDARNRVYVVDSSGQSVFVYSAFQEGSSRLEYLGAFGSEGVSNGAFAYPNGIAVDGRGRLYVADSANDRVQLWSY
jgi:DNA-binding beta-propeller fold protein YncE